MKRVMIRASADVRYSHVLEWYEGEVRRRRHVRGGASAARAAAVRVEESLRGRLMDDGPLSDGEWEAVRMARREGVELRAAVELARRSRGMAREPLVREVTAARCAELARDGLSGQHSRAIRDECARLERFVGDVRVDEVSAGQLLAVVSEVRRVPPAPESMRARLRLIKAVFSWARSRGMMTADPAARVMLPQRSRASLEEEVVSVLTPGESRDLLMAVCAVAPSMLPAVALGLYAGLRQAELQRIEWAQVVTDEGYVEVRPAVAKTRARRLIDIQPALASVLAAVPRGDGRVWPSNGRKLMEAARAAAGWTGERRWPHNALRDSCVSYHYALLRSAAETAAQSGHSERVLFRHYRSVVTPAAAEEYWSTCLTLTGWAEWLRMEAAQRGDARANFGRKIGRRKKDYRVA